MTTPGTAVVAAGSATGERPAPAGGHGARRWWAPVSAALLLAASAALLLSAHLYGAGARADTALTDATTTGQVRDTVESTLTTVFSYSPATLDATRDAARDLLGGEAARQYAALFAQVDRRAAGQRVTLTTRVVRSGVRRITHGTADVLVLLDQHSSRPGTKATVVAAQLSVTARLDGGHWRITRITTR
ncbi:hypothetical protein NX801_08665 [Streptomyces sp. LP05-1]|uniref:Mce-associated membrane protein n=1 Tax=Streptomyces pyxinae TaxID=2970734 RepID=A0ABT2CGK4_9ACTN|nr:hypothetical protein [Streptomyces sp. LP05-1]MCS0635734.1 hypothetical protein [Streptomyces sp. LP05-1]